MKDKRDRSLEICKFYVKALYVAVTRAVRNLYIVEANQQAPLIQLLQLAPCSGEFSLEQQQSSLDEWQREARKLELQGKQEQADDIRARILQQKPVPWPVLDRPRFDALSAKVISGEANKGERLQALEQALMDQGYAAGKLLPIYSLLEPDSLSVEVDGHLVRLDKRLMALFLFNIMMALFYRHAGEPGAGGGGFTAKQLAERLLQLPLGVLPERRKRQAYISSVLSGNEVSREHR